jgi:Ni/Fe-hydrogenase subunit HybB-like protein
MLTLFSLSSPLAPAQLAASRIVPADSIASGDEHNTTSSSSKSVKISVGSVSIKCLVTILLLRGLAVNPDDGNAVNII